MKNRSSAESWEASSAFVAEVEFEKHSRDLKKIGVERNGKADNRCGNLTTKKQIRDCYENYMKDDWLIFKNAETKD